MRRRRPLHLARAPLQHPLSKQKCCEKSENVDRHRISCSIDPKNPFPSISFESFLISCVSTDWQRSRQMFLEINNCVPRGKAYEAFVIENEADRLSDERKYDESRLKAMEGCDKKEGEVKRFFHLKIFVFGDASSQGNDALY